jgi:hypothetical protein
MSLFKFCFPLFLFAFSLSVVASEKDVKIEKNGRTYKPRISDSVELIEVNGEFFLVVLQKGLSTPPAYIHLVPDS